MIVIGLILRVGQGAEILAWGLLAMVMPLSGIFYPVSACPGPSSRWLPCCPPPMLRCVLRVARRRASR